MMHPDLNQMLAFDREWERHAERSHPEQRRSRAKLRDALARQAAVLRSLFQGGTEPRDAANSCEFDGRVTFSSR